MQNNILIFGCGKLQESLIKNAKKLGYFTVGIDIVDEPEAKKICDAYEKVKGDDFVNTCKVVEKYKIDGIVTSATDKPLEIMAMIAEKYAFPFPTLEAVRNTTYKHFFKKKLIENGISTPPVYDGGELLNLKEKDFPLIVKPVDSSGSRGVLYCNNKKEVDEAVKKAETFSKQGKTIVEKYVGGDEYSAESLVCNKKVTLIQITRKYTTQPPFNVELGHYQPADLSSEWEEKIKDIIGKMVIATGLDNCACHTEFKIYNNIPYIIENGARLGGDYITSYLVPLSTSINIEQELLKIAIGKPIRIEAAERKYAAIRYFELKEGYIEFDEKKIQNLKHENLQKIEFNLRNGEKIPKITKSLDRYGFVIVSNNTKPGMQAALDSVYDSVIKCVHVNKQA